MTVHVCTCKLTHGKYALTSIADCEVHCFSRAAKREQGEPILCDCGRYHDDDVECGW